MARKIVITAKRVPRKPEAGAPEASAPETGRLGRPRAFSEIDALDAAMRVFWQRGYEGTSLDDLTQAMGINRSSLYATFGDKETLFRRVLDHYAGGPAAFVQAALAQPTARAVIESLLRGAVALSADPTHPRGCLSLQGGMACGAGAEGVMQAIIDWRKSGQVQIQKRLQRAQAEGDLAKDVNPKDLARYIAIVINGLGVQAANGATQSEMTRAVDLVLRTLPLPNKPTNS